MKKILKIFLCIMLATILLFNSVGCQNCGNTNKNQLGEVGTHIFNIKDTDEYIVKNGSSDYVLVVPQNASTEVMTAREDFIELFNEATGIRLETIKDGGDMPHDTNAKRISLGHTSMLKEVLNKDPGDFYDELGFDGVKLLTKDKTVFLFGARDYGTTFSVYTFMEIYFNFDQYGRNCYDLDTGVTDVRLKNFDVTDVPDVDFRFSQLGTAKPMWDAIRYYELEAGLSANDISNRDRRLRLADGNSGENMIPIYSVKGDANSPVGIIHNTNFYVTEADVAENPTVRNKWRADGGGQLCYTAHGDEDAYTELIMHCAEKILFAMSIHTPDKYPRRNYVPFLQLDAGGFCSCEYCKTAQEECGGALIGVMIKLANKIIEKVQELQVDLPYKRDDIKIVVFAYAQTQQVPAYYDENKDAWVLYQDYAKPNEDMCIWVAPNRISYTNSIYAPVNEEYKTNIEGWTNFAPEMWFYFYNRYYLDYNYFCDNFNFLNTESIKFIATTNASMILDEIGLTDCSDATAWAQLKMYLGAKLYWNSNLNSAELIKKYFNAMFKEASTAMYEAFTFMRDYMSIYADNSELQLTGSRVNSPTYFPYSSVLKPYIEKLDEAVNIIEKKYKTSDIATYNLIMSRITVEYLFPYYAVFDLYGSAGSAAPFSETIKVQYKENLREYANLYFPDLVFGNFSNETHIIEYINNLG